MVGPAATPRGGVVALAPVAPGRARLEDRYIDVGAYCPILGPENRFTLIVRRMVCDVFAKSQCGRGHRQEGLGLAGGSVIRLDAVHCALMEP